MTLVFIVGPPAVGKMTVGLELERLTGFPLFHNHLTAEPVMRLFPIDSPSYRRLVTDFRYRTFEEYAGSGGAGLIFTFVWAFDDARDRAFVESTVALVAGAGGRVVFAELEATQTERLRRHTTPLRLQEKRIRHDVEGSRAFLLQADATCVLNSPAGYQFPGPHLRIDNTALPPDDAARRIASHFSLIGV